jgi:hypothetical protein
MARWIPQGVPMAWTIRTAQSANPVPSAGVPTIRTDALERHFLSGLSIDN